MKLIEYAKGVFKKTIKIAPPYLISLILGYIICNTFLHYGIGESNKGLTNWASAFWHKEVSLKEFLLNLSILLPHDTDLINPPSWYLVYEVKMFLLLPIVVFICNKLTWFIASLLVLISCFFNFPVIGGVIGSFLLGTLLHKLMKSNFLPKQIGGPQLILLTLLSIFLLDIRNIYVPLMTMSSIPFITMFQSLGAAILIYVVYMNQSSCCKNIFLLFMGNISYEVYIIHFIILMAIKPIISNYILFLIAAIILTMISSVMVNMLNIRILKLLTLNKMRLLK